MRTPGSLNHQRGQWSLIGTLVAVAILIVLAGLYIPRIAARHSAAGQPATPMERGYGVVCSEYVSQMNQAVLLYKQDHDEQPPRSLDQLKKYNVTDEMINSPGCAFQMDPSSGNVVDTGRGRAQPSAAAPVTLSPSGSPSPSVSPPPPANSGTRGPGGITIPNIPTSGGGL